MRKIKITLAVLLLAACSPSIPTKPFIITDKVIWINSKIAPSPEAVCIYYYYDANGNRFSFHERWGKYEIGDTIK